MVIVLKVPLLIIMIFFLLFYNMASKLVQFQSRNLLNYIIGVPHNLMEACADGAMNSLKCIYVS